MTPSAYGRERLQAADYRFLAVCLALLAGTVWFSARYFHRAFPEASIDFRVTSAEARQIAGRFLVAQDLATEGYREASRFDFDNQAKTFLERELGLDRAGALMGSRVRLWRWSWRWFRPQEKEEFRVDVTPGGEVAGFSHQLPEEAARPSLPAAEARTRAEEFLRARMERDPAQLEFVEGASHSRPARTDHVFTWKEREFEAAGADYRIEVTVLGSEVGGYREYLKPPETWVREYERLRSGNMAAQSVDSALMVVLVVGLLATIVLRVRARDVRWRRAALVGIVGGALYFFASLNAYPLNEFDYPTTDSYGSFLARNLLDYLLGALASAGLLFVLTAGAEPLYREHFGRFVSLGHLFSPRGIQTRSFLKGAVLGLALTGIFVAYQTAFYLVAGRFGAWSPAEVPYSDMLNTRFPWLFVLLGGFLPAVSEEFLFRLFAIPWLRGLLRSTAAAVVVAGFIWGFGHAAYPQQPFWIRGVEVGIGGVALGYILLRWGVLPALVWHYSVDALYTALLLLRSENLYFVLSGAASAGVMLLPVAVALLLYARRGGFVPEADLTNAAEGTAAPPAEAAPVPEAPAAAYVRWPARKRAAALALGAAGFATLLVPAVRFGAEPRLALTADEARAAAARFLEEHGLRAADFRSGAFPANVWQGGGGDWRPRETARYMLERRPAAEASSAFAELAPVRLWAVRYYRPLEPEEVRVSLNPATGRVTGFRHVLPEDRPGADIPPDAARAIAGEFLESQGLDLAAFELKETTSERMKARRDHVLVWEARPEDPRNVEEARYRVRVQVAGDRVAAASAYWKLPENYLRARAARNALSIALTLLRLAVYAGVVVLGLWLLIRFTRRRALDWRTAMLAALPAALLAVAASLSNLPLMMRGYSTAVPFETFRMMMLAAVAIGAVGSFLAMACAAGLLLGLHAPAAGALRSGARRTAAVDALCAVALATGLAAAVTQCAHLARERFPAQALYSPGAPEAAGAALPALSLAGGAAQQTVFLLAAVALALYILLRRPAVWQRAVLLVLAPAALVSAEVHTPAEFALEYALALAACGAALAFAWFARGNYLAWLLAFWTLAAGARAVAFIAQPAAALAWHGWALAAVWAATLLWAVWPALGGAARRKEAAPAG